MTGAYFFVRPGDKMYKVASCFTNYIELGIPGVTDYYFQGRIEDGSFVINAVLLDKDGENPVQIENSIPVDGSPARRVMTRSGYRFLGSSGETLFELDAQDNVCHLRGRIYDANGVVVAEDNDDDFIINKPPLILGKQGEALAFVVR
jgi:hypothetical protein